jgi:HD-GYP domain-containing protein (c-di-GMP phosphodiesterase class II)
MKTFKHEDLDSDILNDLLEEVSELYEASEQNLIELELRPEDNELQRSLFRSVHTIKGDLGLVSFSPMIPLLQHVEDLLDFLRKGQIDYTSIMSDLVLLTLDRVKLFVESCIQSGQADYDDALFNRLITQIKVIQPDNRDEHEQLLAQAVLLLNPESHVLDETRDKRHNTPIQGTLSSTLSNTGIPKEIEAELQMDILFFRELMQPVERRSMYWKGRGDRIAKLALYINDLAGNPIDNSQLAVACYMHDFGMAFMPLTVLHKQGKLSETEFNLLRSHVYKSARLLEHLSVWDDARKIVMQHHERIDGSGYPMGLKGEQICEGAKLLAILDTFDATTHKRAHDGHTAKPKKKAVIELNRNAKDKYCPIWMDRFNRAIATLLTKP